MEWISTAFAILGLILGTAVGAGAFGLILYSWWIAASIGNKLLEAYVTKNDLARVEGEMTTNMVLLGERMEQHHKDFNTYVHQSMHDIRDSLQSVNATMGVIMMKVSGQLPAPAEHERQILIKDGK